MNIDALVADLKPVRRLNPRDGVVWVAAATIAVVLFVAVTLGLRPDVMAMRPNEMVMLRSGALLLLGVAALHAAVVSARPAIGRRPEGWRWALAAAALFPVASLALMVRGERIPDAVLYAPSAPWCLGVSLVSAVAIGGVLVRWLRKGAVTNPRRSGLLTGLAAGAFGLFAYNLHCSSTGVHYIAIWYSLTILLAALAGRLIVPPLLRW